MSRRSTLSSALVALLCVVTVWATGCADGSDRAASASPTGPATLRVEDATVDVPPLPTQAAVRLRVVNGTSRDDALVAASSPAAQRVTIHRSEVDAEGRSVMVPAPRIAVPARSTVTFEPGGLHVMLTGITRPLVAGRSITLRLRFEHAGWQTASVAVRPTGSTLADGEDHGDHG